MSAALELVTLYLTERCNSRCITCDYWRSGRRHATLESVTRMLPELESSGTHTALISGGEPLLNPEWRVIAQTLRAKGIALWLLTSGLSLAKHAAQVVPLFESITVSLDGSCAATYAAIRGVNAFDKVCQGIRAAAGLGARVGLRVTLQRSNYRELPRFVTLARDLGAFQVSFLAVDVANPHAFARQREIADGLALGVGDLAEFDRLIDDLERDHAEDFASGFVAESPAKLRRLREYFAAVAGVGEFPPVRCNAPEFSAVVGVDGGLSPCFFIPGPAGLPHTGVRMQHGDAAMVELRRAIQAGERSECRRCVCPMYREPIEQDVIRLQRRVAHA